MKIDTTFQGMDSMLASFNKLAMSKNIDPDGLFVLELMRGYFMMFLISQPPETQKAFKEFAHHLCERIEKGIEESYGRRHLNMIEKDIDYTLYTM